MKIKKKKIWGVGSRGGGVGLDGSGWGGQSGCENSKKKKLGGGGGS